MSRLGIRPGFRRSDFKRDRSSRLRRRPERLRALDGLVRRPSVRRHDPRQLPVDEGAPADQPGRLAGRMPRGAVRPRHARRDLALRADHRSLGAGVQGADDHRQPRQADSSRARPARHARLRRPGRSAAGPLRHHLVAGAGPGSAGASLRGWPPLRADLRARTDRPAGDDDPHHHPVQGPHVHHAGRLARRQSEHLGALGRLRKQPTPRTAVGSRSATSASAIRTTRRSSR